MMAQTLVIWLALFAATALADWLAAKWADAPTRVRRANISAVHELVTLIAGFTVFAVFKEASMIVPCVAGAWIGSFLAGVKPHD